MSEPKLIAGLGALADLQQAELEALCDQHQATPDYILYSMASTSA